jgi:hypothetical protein
MTYRSHALLRLSATLLAGAGLVVVGLMLANPPSRSNLTRPMKFGWGLPGTAYTISSLDGRIVVLAAVGALAGGASILFWLRRRK